MKKKSTYYMVLSAMFIAIGVALPILFHNVGLSGSIFLPMHIPVLLCGLICGWKYGLLSGILIPLLSSLATGMPPIFPVAVSMMFELGTYGLVAGLLTEKSNIFVALISAMLAGRVVMGIANMVLLGFAGKAYGLSMFMTGAFVTALPGIIVQIIAVPVIMALLKKTNSI